MPAPKKPTNLKLLEGNPGKRPLPENEPKPKPLMPACPDWLPNEAKAIWEEEAPRLEVLGLLTEIDGEEFARYCLLTIRARQAETELEKSTLLVPGAVPGTMVKNPLVQVSRDYNAAASKLADKFGLNPASRTKIEVKPDEGEERESLLSK